MLTVIFQAGLSQELALTMATLPAADAMGLSDRVKVPAVSAEFPLFIVPNLTTANLAWQQEQTMLI